MDASAAAASSSARFDANAPVPRPVGSSPLPDWMFAARARRVGIAWIAVATAFAAVWSARVDSPLRFLTVWVGCSALVTTPALVVSAKVARRAVGSLRGFWRGYLSAVAGIYATGACILAFAVFSWTPGLVLVALGTGWTVVSYTVAVWRVARARSGDRSLWVDQAEVALVVVSVAGPAGVVIGPRVASGPEPWFTVGCGVVLLFVVAALWGSVVVWLRSDHGDRVTEALGILLAAVALADAFVLALHSASGFALPDAPVLVLHELCMGLLLVLPLHAGTREAIGLRRLPPEAQIRTSWVVAVIVLASLVALALGAWSNQGDHAPWAVGVAVGSLAMLVLCSLARQLFTTRETKALYAEVARSAEARRRLLAEVLQSVEADRRLVAAQLHEQASSSYAAFASFAQAAGPAGAATAGARGAIASDVVRNRLAAQAEALRELTAAIQPLSATRINGGLEPLVRAYADSLWGAARPPLIDVRVADGLVLDWITETVALRVVQEAIANVWRHAAASKVVVAFGAPDGVVVVRVADDGIGFDPDTVPVESGVATMRRFAAFCDGDVHITSAAGEGTTVEARLGAVPRTAPPRDPAPAPVLRLVDRR